jgi:hypothetical protein
MTWDWKNFNKRGDLSVILLMCFILKSIIPYPGDTTLMSCEFKLLDRRPDW